MAIKAKAFAYSGIAVSFAAALTLSSNIQAAGLGVSQTSIQKGQEAAFNRKQGNCLACHLIPGGVSPGNIAPPLVGMKERFPDRAALKEQIYDPRIKNPDTSMLPFGAHGILTDEQINDIVDFLYTL